MSRGSTSQNILKHKLKMIKARGINPDFFLENEHSENEHEHL